MALSFPYPQLGLVKRAPGNGCLACVHSTYCPSLYWFRTHNDRSIVDNYMGTQCASWSNNINDRIKTVTADDLAKNEYQNDQGILREADDSGMTEPTNSGYYRDELPLG